MCCFLCRGLMFLNPLTIVGGLLILPHNPFVRARPLQGAAITWNAPVQVTSPANIVMPAGGTVHFAADFNTPADFGPDDDMINGILFSRLARPVFPACSLTLLPTPQTSAPQLFPAAPAMPTSITC